MEWQKKRSNKKFAGGFGCMIRQKKTFPRQEKGQQHIRSCDVSPAYLLYHSFLTYTIIREEAIDCASI